MQEKSTAKTNTFKLLPGRPRRIFFSGSPFLDLGAKRNTTLASPNEREEEESRCLHTHLVLGLFCEVGEAGRKGAVARKCERSWTERDYCCSTEGDARCLGVGGCSKWYETRQQSM